MTVALDRYHARPAPKRVTPVSYGVSIDANPSHHGSMSQEANAMSTTVSHPARPVILLAAVAAAFALLLITAAGAFASNGDVATDAPAVVVEHVVVSGDTLWGIAERHAEPGDDVRRIVFDIKQANDITTSVIVPGQVLIVPVG
jgi:LysM repeat protein